MSKVFTPAPIEGLRPRVQGLVDEHARRGRRPTARWTSSPTSPSRCRSWSSPRCSACPTATGTRCRDWSHAVVKTLDPIITDDEMLEALRRPTEHMADHCREVVEWKRANPADDLLTALIHAEEDGDRSPPRSCATR